MTNPENLRLDEWRERALRSEKQAQQLAVEIDRMRQVLRLIQRETASYREPTGEPVNAAYEAAKADVQ